LLESAWPELKGLSFAYMTMIEKKMNRGRLYYHLKSIRGRMPKDLHEFSEKMYSWTIEGDLYVTVIKGYGKLAIPESVLEYDSEVVSKAVKKHL
jgi:hypothetical protein